MPISYIDYPSGVAGTRFTISKMFDLVAKGRANPVVIQTATIITRNIPHKDYFGEAAAIFDYVKKDIRYTRDPRGVELLMAPEITLKRGAGDCDDLALVIASLAEAVGMQSGFETVRANAQAPDEFTHVYAIIRTDRGWRAADPTVAGSWFGWRPNAGVYGRKIWTR